MSTNSDKKNFLERMVSTYLTPGLIIGALIGGGVFWGEIKNTLLSTEQKVKLVDHVENTPNDVEVYLQGQKYIEAVGILEGVIMRVDTVQKLYNDISENQKSAIKSRAKRDSAMMEITKAIQHQDSVQRILLKQRNNEGN